MDVKVILSFLMLLAQGYAYQMDLMHLNIDKFLIRHVHVNNNNILLSIKARNATSGDIFYPVIRMLIYNYNNCNSSKVPMDYFPSIATYEDKTTCNGVGEALATNSDSMGRAFILDKGRGMCPAGVLIGHLKLVFVEMKLFLFDEGLSPASMVTIFHTNPIALIGTSNRNILIICTLAKHCEDILVTVDGGDSFPKSTEIMAVSDVEDLLFLTSRNQYELFSIKLEDIRLIAKSTVGHHSNQISAKYVGNLIGKTNSIVINNFKLYYSIPEFNTVVSWNTKTSMDTENHNVYFVAVSKMEEMTQLFTHQSSGVIWILIRKYDPFNTTDIEEVLHGETNNHPTHVLRLDEEKQGFF